MHPEKIKMSMGGEVLESVIGRLEDEELLEFEDWAFDLVGQKKRDGERVVSEGFLNEFLVRGGVKKRTMRELIGSMWFVEADEFDCSEIRILVLVLIINCKDC
ncbi:putative glycoprotein 2-beta-D-xylosyltransferase [Helianthus anomalus]